MPNCAQDPYILGGMAIVRDNGNYMKGKLNGTGLDAMFVGYMEYYSKKDTFVPVYSKPIG